MTFVIITTTGSCGSNGGEFGARRVRLTSNGGTELTLLRGRTEEGCHDVRINRLLLRPTGKGMVEQHLGEKEQLQSTNERAERRGGGQVNGSGKKGHSFIRYLNLCAPSLS